MRVCHAMAMVVGVVAEEDETVLLQAQQISRSHSDPSAGSDNCVLSWYNSCKDEGTWNGGKCCYPSHYTCESGESVTKSSCNDIWTGYVCCKSGATPSCQNSEGAAIMDTNMEDCTNKNFHVWDKGTEDVLHATRANVTEKKLNGMKQNWKGSCIAHITGTAGPQSCSGWCKGHGLQCVMAMDDASTLQQNQLSAWMPAGKSSQCSVGNQYHDDEFVGCDKELNTQICACEKTSCQNSEGVAIMDTNMVEDCTNKYFYVWDKGTEDVLDATEDNVTEIKLKGMKLNWKGSCIAHITGKQSCSEWCKGHGLQCVMAMDDASTIQQNQLSAWMPAGQSSQCSLGNQYYDDEVHGCDKELNTQICACDKTVA